MAFNQNDAANLLALKNEVFNNPGIYGDTDGSTADLLAKLNDPALNAGAETGSAPMTCDALLTVLFDDATNISGQDQFKLQLLYEASQGLNDDLSKYKPKISALSTSLSDAIALIIRPLSRAEVLFATDDANGVKETVTISRTDWFAARDS